VPFASGDVLVGVGAGQIAHYSSSGTLKDTLDSGTTSLNETGQCFDGLGRLRSTNYNAQSVSLFSSTGTLTDPSWANGFVLNPESCVVDAAQDVYVGESDGDKYITEFDSQGNKIATFSPASDTRGSDWIDLASDQCTMYYTSEGNHVKRFNVCTNTQLPDFATFADTTDACYTVRIRTSDVLVACEKEVYRLDLATGTVLQSYSVASVGATSFFGLDLAPDGASFWAADPDGRTAYRIRIADGVKLSSFSFGPAIDGTDGAALTVVGATTASGGSIPLPPPPTGYQPPTVNAGGPYGPAAEGSPINVSGSASDPSGFALHYKWTVTPPASADAGAGCTFAVPTALSTTVTCNDEGVYSLTLKAFDLYGTSTSTTSLTITDVPPVVTTVAPVNNAIISTDTSGVASVSVSASFTDAGTVDTHACRMQLDTAALPTAGTVTEPSGLTPGRCTATMQIAPGVYRITVSVSESENTTGNPPSFNNATMVGSSTVQIVVYDPTAGFVVGAGTIVAPPGSLPANPSLTGQASFGFVSKYLKGSLVPIGETEFQFKLGSINFHSSAYQWLIVAGNTAEYKGSGSINGVSGYSFTITAVDGGKGAGGLRMKITDSTGKVIFDDVPGGCDSCGVGPTQPTATGMIVVHSGK
jgi:hypothetical protein